MQTAPQSPRTIELPIVVIWCEHATQLTTTHTQSARANNAQCDVCRDRHARQTARGLAADNLVPSNTGGGGQGNKKNNDDADDNDNNNTETAHNDNQRQEERHIKRELRRQARDKNAGRVGEKERPARMPPTIALVLQLPANRSSSESRACACRGSKTADLILGFLRLNISNLSAQLVQPRPTRQRSALAQRDTSTDERLTHRWRRSDPRDADVIRATLTGCHLPHYSAAPMSKSQRAASLSSSIRLNTITPRADIEELGRFEEL